MIRHGLQKKGICVGLASNQKSKYLKDPVTDERFKFISEAYFRNHIDNVMELKAGDNIILIGGEPLIHPKIFGFIKLLKRKGANVSVWTNARMLANMKFCKKLSEMIEEIIVVDPADNKEDYENISGVNGSWEQSREGIENWKEMGGKVVHFHP